MSDDDLRKQLDEMVGINNQNPTTDEPDDSSVTVAPTTDIPDDEVIDDDTSDDSEDDGGDEVITNAPTTKAPTTNEPDEEDELTKAKIRIAELEALMGGNSSNVSTDAPTTKSPTTDAPIGDIDFVGDVDMEDLTSDSKVFNKILNEVYKKGVEQGKGLKENVLNSIPNVIKHSISQQMVMQKAAESFYENNPDLGTPDRRRIVGMKAEQIIAEHPEYDLEKLFAETEKSVRELLNLKKGAITNNKGNKPSFGKKTKGKTKPKPKEKLSELQKEIDDMIAATE